MTLTITQPDDWHIHLRDDNYLKTTVPHAAARFARVMVMPNLKPPINNIKTAARYKKAILEEVPPDVDFNPLMTLYLTDQTTTQDIIDAKKSGIIFGCKLYPAGATTNSANGVTKFEALYPVFEKMMEVDLPLLVHGEVTDELTDIFDREAKFIDLYLSKWTTYFQKLRIVLEHITTKSAVEFISESSSHLAATITVHHLLLNRNDLFVGGIQPHHYCLPVLKRRTHQEALIQAATCGSTKFFLGTDSAPHSKESKETSCGCAGIYTAHAALELYCEIFEKEQALDKLEAFTSFNGADFYQLPRNTKKIKLKKEPWKIPDFYSYGDTTLIPFRAGELVNWKLDIS